MKNVYFLTVHSPYQEPDAPGPVNGLITHARTLLHPDLPQPGAGPSRPARYRGAGTA